MSNGQSSDDKTVISITYLYIEKYVEGRDRDFGCLVGLAINTNKKMLSVVLSAKREQKEHKKILQQSTDESYFVQYVCIAYKK